MNNTTNINRLRDNKKYITLFRYGLILFALLLTFAIKPTIYAVADEGGAVTPPTPSIDEMAGDAPVGETIEEEVTEEGSSSTTIIDNPSGGPAKDAQAVVDLITRLQNIVFAAAGAIAIAMIVWGGFLMMTAGGNEDRIGKGKKVLTYAVGGVALILLSYTVVTLLVRALGGTV